MFNYVTDPPVPAIPPTAEDYRDSFFGTDTPIVIDNGSYQCRAGWGTEDTPRLQFENIIAKYRGRKGQNSIVVTGNELAHDPLARSNVKSAFDGNVVCNFDTMEHVLDYIFLKLGVDTHGVHHPILMTEAISNPPAARRGMTELLFECYSVPSLAYGVDSLFSYYENGFSLEEDGIIVAPGHSSTHVLPVIAGKGNIQQCKRLAYGGSASTEYMLKLMQLKYPTFPLKMTSGQAQEIVQKYSYVAPNYADELRTFEDFETLEEKTCTIQFPFVPPPTETRSPEELERLAAKRKESGKRLQEQAAKARLEKLIAREQELEQLKKLKEIKSAISKREFNERLKTLGYKKEEEFENSIKNLEAAVRRARNKELGIDEIEEKEPPTFPLIDIPDDQLEESDKREKRKQKLMKANYDARMRAKAAKEEEKEKEEELAQMSEDRRKQDPEKWLQEQHAARQDVIERMNARKKKREALMDRRSHASQMRMKSIANLAAEEKGSGAIPAKRKRRGQEEDTFGKDDDDWAVYREITKGEDSEEEEESSNLLQAIEGRLLEHDPNFLPSHRHAAVQSQTSTLITRLAQGQPTKFVEEGDTSTEAEATKTDEYAKQYRVRVNVERCRVPEAYFQPSLAGLDQAGVVELVGDMLKRLDLTTRSGAVQNVFLTGGPTHIPSFDDRLRQTLRSVLPPNAPLRVHRAKDPILDAWKGAALWTRSSSEWKNVLVRRQDYEEYGAEWFKDHQFSGSFLGDRIA